MSAWSIDAARRTYSIAHWGEGYFDIDAHGRVTVRPHGAQGPDIALPEAVDAALAQGLKLPLLLRFSDILGHRLGRLQGAFAQAMENLDYAGGYTAIYPIKVNQHRSVAGELARHAGEGFGLKPAQARTDGGAGALAPGRRSSATATRTANTSAWR